MSMMRPAARTPSMPAGALLTPQLLTCAATAAPAHACPGGAACSGSSPCESMYPAHSADGAWRGVICHQPWPQREADLRGSAAAASCAPAPAATAAPARNIAYCIPALSATPRSAPAAPTGVVLAPSLQEQQYLHPHQHQQVGCRWPELDPAAGQEPCVTDNHGLLTPLLQQLPAQQLAAQQQPPQQQQPQQPAQAPQAGLASHVHACVAGPALPTVQRDLFPHLPHVIPHQSHLMPCLLLAQAAATWGVRFPQPAPTPRGPPGMWQPWALQAAPAPARQ